MSNEDGPWSHPPPGPPPGPPPPARPRGRPWLWLVIVGAVGGLIVALVRAFPEAMRTGDDWASVGYLAGFLVLVTAGFARARPGAISQHLRHAAIWAGIIAVLALGFADREELAGVPQRRRRAFSTGAPVATAEHELVIPQNDEGGFVVVGLVNGQRVLFVVDTGATDTVLSPADARRLGVPMDELRYIHESETANGTGLSAPYEADRLEIGPIGFNDFRMSINQAPLSSSLLGLSFLDRLESYEFRGRKLILKWRDNAETAPPAAR